MTRDRELNGLGHYERFLDAQRFESKEPAALNPGDVAAEAKRLYEAFLPSRLRQLRPADDKDLMSAAALIFRLLGEVERMREALKKIERWEMPPSGRFWDNDEKDPMSYGAAFGSSGERDHIRDIARRALAGSAKE